MNNHTMAIESLAPIVPVRDVAATVAFYTDTLGFESRFVSSCGTVGMVGYGPFEIQLLATDNDEVLHATANNISIYVRVKDVDALYEELKDKLEALPEGRLRAPFDQHYRMREFHVKDPDGCLLFFGQPI